MQAEKQTVTQQRVKPKVGFAIDIDGTLTLARKPLPNATQALERLISNEHPFLLLTNNVAQSEAHKAREINEMFKLSKDIKPEQVVLGYTPIKDIFKQKNPNEIVLIIGREERLEQMLPLEFIRNYMTPREYCSIFPQCVAYSTHQRCQKTVQKLKNRLKLEQLTHETLKFSAVLILAPPQSWQQSFQIIMDVLSTSEGKVSTGHSYVHHPDHIPVITVFNDMFLGSVYHLPRFLIRPFNESLKTVYKQVYGSELDIQVYGKPEKLMYDCARKQLEENYGKLDRVVMIGDNEQSDIEGAYRVGWESILVKTGVNKGDSEMATINAVDILEGIKIYAEKNDLPF